MTNDPHQFLFSVVIPTFNRAESLRRALGSLVDQTDACFEVIVCDDGSTDSTPDVVDSFKSSLTIQYLREENWGGPARPRNNGIRVAAGEWICFLDSDDWWYPQKIATVKKYIDSHAADVFYHRLDIYTETGHRFWNRTREKQLKKPVFIELLKHGQGPANSSVVVRKKIVEKVGGLSEDKALIAVEDYDLLLKVARVTERFFYVPYTLGAYWSGGGNITEMSDLQIARVQNVYKKHEHYLSPQQRDEINKILSYIVGRIKQQMGSLSEARILFAIALHAKQLSIRIKALLMILWVRGECAVRKISD
ncbi:glycosyltransferase family 2 protein [Thermodesulfobacteriota bacterium]